MRLRTVMSREEFAINRMLERLGVKHEAVREYVNFVAGHPEIGLTFPEWFWAKTEYGAKEEQQND